VVHPVVLDLAPEITEICAYFRNQRDSGVAIRPCPPRAEDLEVIELQQHRPHLSLKWHLGKNLQVENGFCTFKTRFGSSRSKRVGNLADTLIGIPEIGGRKRKFSPNQIKRSATDARDGRPEHNRRKPEEA
jgi:hypothetical protein